MSNENHIIIGGGIAGLSIGLSLKKAGFEPAIFEAYPEPRDNSGSFFGLHPNGRDVLETLGLAQKLAEEGVATKAFHFSDQLGSLTMAAADVVTIRRGAVTAALGQEALRQNIPIRYGMRLSDVSLSKHDVTATFMNGECIEGASLIGGDGIHSQTRRIVFGNSPNPYYTGTIRSSAMTKNNLGLPPTEGVTEMFIGRHAFFSYLVSRDGLIYWFSNHARKTEPARGEIEAIPQPDWQAELQNLYIEDHPMINQIITATHSPIHKYPVYDMALVPRWHQGRVCIVGDAAHAPSPKAGQGASMALEDAIVIAKCLRDAEDVPTALSLFERIRKPRVETLFNKTRPKVPPSTSHKQAESNVSRSKLSLELKADSQVSQWMYDYHIDWDETVADF